MRAINRTARLVTFQGRSTSIVRWAKELGLDPKTLHDRIVKRGWSAERALTEPAGDVSGFARQHPSEHRCWTAMKRRCTNQRQDGFSYYGGRGVRVCERWMKSFRDFFEDMGPRPSPNHSLDRFPNQKGNYEPGNVRWATAREQTRNSATVRLITWRGRTMPLTDWATELGIKSGTLGRRLDAGWPVAKALTTPVRKWPSQRRALEQSILEGRLGQ